MTSQLPLPLTEPAKENHILVEY